MAGGCRRNRHDSGYDWLRVSHFPQLYHLKRRKKCNGGRIIGGDCPALNAARSSADKMFEGLNAVSKTSTSELSHGQRINLSARQPG